MEENQSVSFGPYHFEPHNAQLRRGKRVLPLTRKACAVLQSLVAQPGQLVTKDALFQAVWPEMVVSEGVLTNCIAELRQALGDNPKRPRYIATVHRQGYRFIAPLSPLAPARGLVTASGPSPLSPPLPASQPLTPLLVGREAELAHLHHLYTQALHGQRHVVFVTGEAGVGKTAVVEALVQGLRHDPGLWIGHGQCIEQYGAGEAYLPLLEALDRLCRGPGGERLVALLAQYAPSWVVQLPALLSASTLADLQHTLVGTTRERMLRELSGALDVVSAVQPLVLVLEDLHWSDPSTVEALAMLARRREPARLLVVGTYRATEVVVRDHPLKTVKHELIARGQGVEVALRYLSQAAVQAYVAARVEDHGAAATLAPVVYRRTDGHPLFMVQVTDYLVQAGEPLLATPVALSTLEQALPQGLRELIEAQLGRLTEEEQQVLAVGSVAGAVFAVASVAVGLQRSDVAIEAVCERLARRGQFLDERGLETWPDGTVSGRYGFRHALYQEVIYKRLGSGLQARLHRQMGERLAHAYGERAHEVAVELAVHCEQGRDYQRAVQYLQQAAENALQRYAYHEAIGHLTRGLEVLHSLPSSSAHARHALELHTLLGMVLTVTKGFAAPEAAHVYARVRELGQQMGDTTHLFQALWGLWAHALVRAELHTARELGEELMRLAERAPSLADQRKRAHNVQGMTLFWCGELVPARTHFEHGLALDKPQQRMVLDLYGQDAGVVALSYLSCILWFLGYPEQALRTSSAGLTAARRLAHPHSLAFGLNFAAWVHRLRTEVPAMHERVTELATLTSQEGFAHWAAQATMWHGWILTVQGQYAEGIAQVCQGLTAHRTTGARLSRTNHLTLLAEAYSTADQAAEGLRVLAEAQTSTDPTGERLYEAEMHRIKGELLLQQAPSEASRAESCFHQALAVARQQQAKSLELRAAMSLSRLWQQQGKQAEAHALLAPIYGWFTEGFDTADLQEAKMLLAALA